MRVVCINENWRFNANPYPGPKKGEICEVIRGVQIDGVTHYILNEYPPDEAFICRHFRPVDDTFGPAVCERIEEMIEYEQAIEV